jgi:ribosomal protein S18 acetylase RimI-like enzyme
MRIRPFSQADTETVVEIWERCGLVRPWNDPLKDIARKAEVQPELFLVGELAVAGAPRIVATAMAGYDGHRGWVNYLAVDPGAQRQGLAREMMTEVERLLLARGCPKVNLQVREGNAAALGLYVALGYTMDASVSLGKRLVVDGPGPGAPAA